MSIDDMVMLCNIYCQVTKFKLLRCNTSGQLFLGCKYDVAIVLQNSAPVNGKRVWTSVVWIGTYGDPFIT